MAEEKGVIISENEIRKVINQLRSSGMIEVHVGRAGSKVTLKGIETLKLHSKA